MGLSSARSRTLSTNGLFGAFFLTVFGWGLLHAWGMQVEVSLLFHILFAIPGFVLCGITIYRYRKHWPLGTPARVNGRAMMTCLLLPAIGAGMALLAVSGAFLLLPLTAFGAILFPWSRIAACRNHFFMSSALIGAGAIPGLVFWGRQVHPLYYPIAAWIFLAVACTAVMSTILTHRDRLERMPAAGYSPASAPQKTSSAS